MSESSKAAFMNTEGIIHYKAGEFTEAISCWEEAASLGNSSAMFGLGVIYIEGVCVKKDVVKARVWFEKAVAAGHKNAIKQLEKLNTAELDIGSSLEKKKPSEKANKIELPKIRFGSYEWVVLNRQESKILCISKDIIDIRRYNEINTNVTWEACTLRKWLNSEFLNRFSETEQKQICETTVVNDDNSEYGTTGGNETRDKIFLLSLNEAIEYFGDNGILEHAKNIDLLMKDQDAEVRKSYLNMTQKQLVEAEKRYEHDYSKLNGQSIGWWLRTPGSSNDRAVRINCNGAMRVHGRFVNYDLNGVRPVFWMNTT